MGIFFLTWLEILTLELPVAVVDRAYEPEPIRVAGGSRCTANNIGLQVVLGKLPPGVALSTAGYLRGTPTAMGSYTFAIRAANDCGYTTQAYTLRVEAAPVLQVSARRLDFRWKAGSLVPEAQTMTVASNRAGMAYEVTAAHAPWLTAEPLRGRTPRRESAFVGDPVRVTVDPRRLGAGTYRTELEVAAWETEERVRIPVVLTVSPPAP